MYEADLDFLRCPETGERLVLGAAHSEDGEIVDGTLNSSAMSYPITNGIPRFTSHTKYNPTWDYKWRVLDAGNAYNYRVIDKADRAYQIHDLFDRNSHEGLAYKRATGGVALDLGCGIGQYAVRLAQDYHPRKVIAVDLTSGVDIFRKVLLERYPHLRDRFLIAQANVFSLPFAPETFDFIMSLGVLHHTGDTRKALGIAAKLLKPEGEMNVWLYCSEPVAYSVSESGREEVLSLANVEQKFIRPWKWPIRLIHLFRKLDHDKGVRLLRFLSSDFMFKLSRHPRFRWTERIFAHVDYPDPGYRMINHYDGYMNTWDDSWSEHEMFPILRENSIALVGLSGWRLGLWGRKMPNFYAVTP